MSSSATCSYTPPPPPQPSDAPSSALKTIEYPVSATPLPPPSPSISSSAAQPARGSATGEYTKPSSHTPQIRYCYFISATAQSPNISGDPSVGKKTIYLTPQVQEPMDVSPNCTQPRSRTTKDTLFILGPHPPQIQLQFLQDEPLPPPSISEKVVVPEIAASRCDSSTAVLVERKDSGYGGSVSRSSSLAAFGRGIRKVFWRTSPKGPIESAIVTDPPVLDCDIPQDVLDHESWAQDLAERLSLASGPDVAAWLGQLSPNTLFSASESKQERAADTQVTVVNLTEASTSSESLMDTIEEIIFMIPHPVPAQAPSTPTADVTMEVLNEPVMSTTPTNPAQGKAGKSLRHVLSVEQLNKPQPPLPADSIDKRPVPAVPAQTKVAIATSSFNSFTKKLAIGTDFKFGRSLGKGTQQRHRASVQQYFQESTSETALTSSSNSQRRERRSTGPSIERLLDDPSMDSPLPLMASPEEVEGASYVSVKPASKKTSRFFMSLTAASATDMKQRHDKEVRPMSEVLLPHPSLDGEDLSRDIASSCTASLHSHLRHSIPQWEESSSDLWSSLSLEPPEPLFYNKGGSSSASSLGETSSCGSVDSSAVDSSADEWDGLTRMAEHARQQNARYDADLKDLQALLYQVDNSNRSRDTPMHSANTSTGSLCLPSQTSPSDKKESKSIKVLPKKDDYMSHRLSSFSPKLLPISGRTKPRSKSGLSRLSAAYGGGELEVVKQAKFDTPESIARNKEIRKFISQEIYTTELNYLQYMRTIQDVFVEPLFKSLEIDKPFIPKANPLYQLLAHISALMAVSNQLVERLEACVRDEVWSDESSMVGTIFLDAKEPLSIFLKYGQSYGKGMKALRSLMKSKRASIVSVNSMAHMDPNASPRSSVSMPEAPRMDKRRSLPSLFSLNTAPGAPNSVLLESSWTGSSNASAFVDGNPSKMNGTDLTGSTKPRSSHGAASVILREVSEYDRFLQNCARCQETAGRFSLADLLILPIQRVTRYCLLLKDLKKHTAVEHEDYVGLVHALEQVHTLALATNNAQPTSLRL